MPTNPKRPTPTQNEPVFAVEEPSASTALPPPPPAAAMEAPGDQELPAEYNPSVNRAKPFAFLYVERGPGMGQLLEVKQSFVVIGRASVSDLRLLHPSISRRHAQVRRDGQQYFVKDLGSQNGTFVNKQRISSETEIKPGDSIALGNALLRLRGPLAKGERLPKSHTPVFNRAAATTGVVARAAPAPLNETTPPTSTALKVAVFIGAVGFSLAGVLAFALVKTMSTGKSAATTVTATPGGKSEQAKLIDEAIARTMAERQATAKAAEAPPPPEEPTVESDSTVTVKGPPPKAVATPAAPKASLVVSPAPAPVKVAAAPKAAPPPPKEVKSDDEEEAAPKAGGTAKRAQILAAYEKGNAEASLTAAQAAGDKELTDKLSRFLAAHEAANEALMANNGSAAITQFQKALLIDEGLSSGWGKYGAEIRRQLSNLYVLVGLQFAASGESEKAKAAFQGALKHQPGNQRAKEQLAKLGDGETAPTEKPKAPSKRSIDSAFEE